MEQRNEFKGTASVQTVGQPDATEHSNPPGMLRVALQETQLSAPERELVERLINRLRQL